MSTKTAALIGATGMIGTYLLEELIKDPYFATIRVIVRRPFPNNNPKIEVKLVDFDDYESLKLAIDGSDALFCTIGTTQKKVKGDKELYRKIDFAIPAKTAGICKETGCEKFIIVTCVGADSKSGTFYLKLKGEVEDAIIQSGIESVHIMQPSMLLGDRKEKRTVENIMQGVMNVVSVVMIGSLQKYKSIHGKDIAMAMLHASEKDSKGIFRYTYNDMVTLSR
jgi:uncharacterized protein YbjT (DUF2867 family)